MTTVVTQIVGGLAVLVSSLAAAISPASIQADDAESSARTRVDVSVGFIKRLPEGGLGVDPVSGVEVRLFHVSDPLATLGTAVSEPDGGAAFELSADLAAIDEKGSTGLRCESTESGYIRNVNTIRAAGARLTANVYLEEGSTQRVRVLGAEEHAKGRLRAMRWESKELMAPGGQVITERVLKEARHTRVIRLGGGINYVHFEGDISADLLLLELRAQGTGVVPLPKGPRGFVEPTDEVLDIELQGAATLTGTILDNAGVPSPGLRLWCSWTSLESPGLDRHGDPLASTLLADGLGHVRGTAVTKSDGTFQISGLRPGRYRVATSYAKEGKQLTVELGFVELSNDSPPVQYQVHRTLLEVRLQGFADEEGMPFFHLPDHETDLDGPHGILSVYDAGPVGSAPAIAPGHSRGGLPSAEAFWRGFEWTGGDSVTPIDLVGGRQYLVLVQGRKTAPVPHLVTIPKVGDRVTLTIEPTPDELASSLDISFITPVAWSTHSTRRGGIGLLIEDAETGIPFYLVEGKELKELERSFRVPAREVRVVAKGRPVRRRPRDLGRVETVVSMKSGVETLVPLGLQPGGVLEVQVIGTIQDDERPWSEAWLTLLDANGREVESVLRPGQVFRGASGFGPGILESWPLSETNTSEILPDGAYTLRATLLDRPPLLVPVTITAGETLKVKLTFP